METDILRAYLPNEEDYLDFLARYPEVNPFALSAQELKARALEFLALNEEERKKVREARLAKEKKEAETKSPEKP